MKELHAHDKTLKRLAHTSYYPSSARLKFKVTVSDTVLSRKEEESKNLKLQAEIATLNAQKQLT